MAIQDPSFWDRLGPGLLQLGGGYLGSRMAARRGESDLRKAQGPLYDQLMGQAGSSLSLAGGVDPSAMAKLRFDEQQALLAPGREADRQQLMRELQKKGLLDVSSYMPVPGTVAAPGTPMNPHLAALYAAQEGAKAQSAYGALREGEAYLDNLLKRSGLLQTQAQTARSTGQVARGYLPSKPSIGETLLKGGMGVLRDKGARDLIASGIGKVGGLFGSGLSWLSTPSSISPWSISDYASNYDAGSGLWE